MPLSWNFPQNQASSISHTVSIFEFSIGMITKYHQFIIVFIQTFVVSPPYHRLTSTFFDKQPLRRQPEADNCAIAKPGELVEEAVEEPYVGMEFESEDAARRFYTDYATRQGFIVRVMQQRRSEIDGKILSRRLGCNKQGFSRNHKLPDKKKKPRPSSREGCKASILVKIHKSGKWIVTRFVKDHNHPLILSAPPAFPTAGDKDKKIEKLTLKLERENKLCEAYREKLVWLLSNIEEHAGYFSSKVEQAVQNVRKVEAELRTLSQHNR